MRTESELDRLVHEPARLRILTILRNTEEVDFAFFQGAMGLTKGNLACHLRKLEDAGYITVTKQFRGRRPCTTYCLTKLGTEKYDQYVRRIKFMIGGQSRG